MICREREKEPHFAPHGSFEYEFGIRWKQLDEMEKKRIENVKKEMEEARIKLEDEMQNALYDYQAEQIRQGEFFTHIKVGKLIALILWQNLWIDLCLAHMYGILSFVAGHVVRKVFGNLDILNIGLSWLLSLTLRDEVHCLLGGGI